MEAVRSEALARRQNDLAVDRHGGRQRCAAINTMARVAARRQARRHGGRRGCSEDRSSRGRQVQVQAPVTKDAPLTGACGTRERRLRAVVDASCRPIVRNTTPPASFQVVRRRGWLLPAG